MKTKFFDILNEIKKSAFSVLPIYFLCMLLLIFGVIKLEAFEIVSFSLATIFVILGIALFNYGADNAMTPIGKLVGKGITKKGKLAILVLVVFCFGFFITISEPDLSVLAKQTESVFPKLILIASIGIGVALFLIVAVLKVIKKVSLTKILSMLYMTTFALVAILNFLDKDNMIALSFDSGGVTTGPMTVPFLMAIGVGVSSIVSKKSEKDATFGFVAFSSIGPVIVMLVLCLFSKGSVDYELPKYEIGENFISSFLSCVLDKAKEVGIAILLIAVMFLIVDALILHTAKEKLKNLFIGLIFAYIGLVIFLSAVDCSYMGIGFKIGKELSEKSKILTLIICFVIGALTVLAEPAIKILVTQVEEITNRVVKKTSLLIALAIGVGSAIVVSVIRMFYEFSILYIILPGYVLCFFLSFFIERIYTAIAFDAGGVATGPLTTSFILPIILGLCSSLFGQEGILQFGFGIVALVALSPLLSIEILGVVSNIRKTIKSKNEVRKVLKNDDKIIIKFPR